MIPIPDSPYQLGVGFEKFANWREGQEDVLNRVLTSPKKFILLDAPTGFGKTLVASAIHKLMKKSPSTYSCSTKKLQDQYMNDFHGFAEVLKGRSEYPCLLKGIKSAANCIHTRDAVCESLIFCPYRRQVEAAEKAELACLNIWSLIYQVKFSKRFIQRHLLILDEADAMEGSLVEVYRRELTPQAVANYLLRSPDFQQEDVNYWKGWLRQAMKEIIELIREIKDDEELKNKFISFYVNTLQHLDASLSNSWVIQADGERVAFLPTNLGDIASELLFDHYEKVVLMSASFCGPEVFVDALGIPPKDYEYLYVPSNFQVHKRPIYFLPTASINYQNKEETLPQIVHAVDSILNTFPGEQAIVHTTSFANAQALEKMSVHPITTYDSQDGKIHLHRFKQREVPILVGPSIDRGFDFPNDECRLNILMKVPYPNRGDKWVLAKEKLHKHWYEWKTVQSLIQMTGRSTRSERDFSLSFILDKSFQRLLTRPSVRKLFPKWWLDAGRVIKTEHLKPDLLKRARE